MCYVYAMGFSHLPLGQHSINYKNKSEFLQTASGYWIQHLVGRFKQIEKKLSECDREDRVPLFGFQCFLSFWICNSNAVAGRQTLRTFFLSLWSIAVWNNLSCSLWRFLCVRVVRVLTTHEWITVGRVAFACAVPVRIHLRTINEHCL